MPAAPRIVNRTDLSGLLARGKVRDLYGLGDQLLIVATDRISAFDVVMTEPVPGKGVILTRLSEFWLGQLPACRPHHLHYVVGRDRVPSGLEDQRELLAGRAMVVQRCQVLPVECIVRGYLAGSGWKEYQQSRSVCGVSLPAGLHRAAQLPEPIFTPTTKAHTGHDEPLDFEGMVERLREFLTGAGQPQQDPRHMAEHIRDRSIEIYEQAARHAESRGIIIADTKFEFGLHGSEVLLVDEVLTPDSSRFWPLEAYRPGSEPPSFDKQYLRDHLEAQSWNKQPPPPPLPPVVVERTQERYEAAYRLLTGREIEYA